MGAACLEWLLQGAKLVVVIAGKEKAEQKMRAIRTPRPARLSPLLGLGGTRANVTRLLIIYAPPFLSLCRRCGLAAGSPGWRVL